MVPRSFFKRSGVTSFVWLLACLINVVPAEDLDVPLEEQCTSLAVHGCYVLYEHVLWNAELKPDHDGHLNNTAFYTACNNIKEKSSCHKIIANCPKKAEMDLSRLERGYQLMRDFVCDIELFKDFQRAMMCEDYDKMAKCNPAPPQEHDDPPYDKNSYHCRSTIKSWDCREEALRPECSVRLTKAKASYSKVREAVALLSGCDYNASAAHYVAPQSVFWCLITVSFLRWMYASC